MEYYVWEEPGRLVTRTATFRVAGIVPVEAGDRDLTPTLEGVSDSPTLQEWDPPFPVDLRRIRPTDEEYWRRYKTTPKAFVPLEVRSTLVAISIRGVDFAAHYAAIGDEPRGRPESICTAPPRGSRSLDHGLCRNGRARRKPFGVARSDGLWRVLRVLQFFSRHLCVAACGAFFQARRRAARPRSGLTARGGIRARPGSEAVSHRRTPVVDRRQRARCPGRARLRVPVDVRAANVVGRRRWNHCPDAARDRRPR